MEIITKHQIYYSNKEHVPIGEIAESLIALEGIIRQSPAILQKIFPGTAIQRTEIYLDELKSGSLYEDVVIKFIFGSQEKFDEFIENARDKVGLSKLESKGQILSAIIILLILTGGSYYLGKSKKAENPSLQIIDNSINITINNGAQLLDMPPEEFRNLIENNIPDKDKLARDSINFIKPAKKDSEASIIFDRDESLKISSESVQAMPNYIIDDELQETIEDLDNIEVLIRATDLDSNKRGWAAIIPDVSQSRVRLQLDPHIKSEELMQHPDLIGSVTILFKLDEKGEKKPKLYFLREIYSFVDSNH